MGEIRLKSHSMLMGVLGFESGSLIQTLSLHMVKASRRHLGNLPISLYGETSALPSAFPTILKKCHDLEKQVVFSALYNTSIFISNLS